MNYPCEHVMCFECSQPEKGYCYICEEKIERCERRRDNEKLYECDYPDCFKFFQTNDKLKLHKQNFHGIFNNNNTNGINMGMNFGMGGLVNRAFIPGQIPGQFVNPVIGLGQMPYK